MAKRMQQRRGTAAQWISTNDGDGPILNVGEIGFESDTGKFKMGDGVNHWIDLDYFLDESEINSITGDYVPTSTLAQPNGVATLDGSGKLTSSQVPNIDELAQDAVDSALVAGTGLDKTYNDGSNTITLDIDSTVTTNDGTQTLTNKTISGTSNSLSNIPNAALDYHSITINGNEVNLGGSTTIDALPSQTGQNGKYLTTDGSDASWSTIDLSSKQDVVAGVSDTEIGYLSDVTSDIQSQIDSKAPTASPTFTGTVSGITATMVGLGNADNTSDLDKPISTATQNALDDKLSLSGGTMTGDIVLSGVPTQALHPATKSYVDNAIEGLVWKTQVNLLANSDTDMTGATGTLVIDSHSALDQTDNNNYRILLTNQDIDAENGIYVYTDNGSTYTLVRADDASTYDELIGASVYVVEGTTYGGTAWIQSNHYLTTFANQSWTQFSGAGTVTAGNGIDVNGLQISIDTATTVDTSTAQTLTNKTLTSPVINTPTGITKTDVGLGNVDNTADTDKPVSTATQTALDLKAPLASPTFTGTVTLPNATVTNSMLANSGITINGSSVSLGGSTNIPTGATAQAVSSNISLEHNYNYFVDTSAARTLTLSATPSLGDTIAIIDAVGSASTNKITVSSNGGKINGTVQDLEIDVNNAAAVLVYTGSSYGWRVG